MHVSVYLCVHCVGLVKPMEHNLSTRNRSSFSFGFNHQHGFVSIQDTVNSTSRSFASEIVFLSNLKYFFLFILFDEINNWVWDKHSTINWLNYIRRHCYVPFMFENNKNFNMGTLHISIDRQRSGKIIDQNSLTFV